MPDLLDHLVRQSHALALEQHHGIGRAPLVDRGLQPVDEIGRRVALSEVERRFGEEQAPHRHALRRGEQREHGARRMPEHRGIAARGRDHRREILDLALRVDGCITAFVAAVDARPPVVGDGAQPLLREGLGDLAGIPRRGEGAVHDDDDRAGARRVCCDAGAVGGRDMFHVPITAGGSDTVKGAVVRGENGRMSSASRSIGIIGVGRMGRPIAERLSGAGFDVAVYDADSDRRRAAADRGLTVVRGAAALAARSDVLVTVLPGAPEFADVMATGGDVATSLRPGSVWLDLTSNDPRVATAVLAAGRTGGVEGVGAPMGGGPADARAGTLSFFVGGAPAAVGRVMPVLDAIGRDGGIRLVGGDIAHGYLLKLLVNALWFGQVAATAEAYLVAESLGLSRRDFAAGLAGTAAQSAFTDVYLPRLIDGDVVADFGLSGCRDELAVVQGIARHAGIPTAVLDAVTRLHADALARFGAIDGEMLVARHIELAAGGQPPG